MSARNNDMRRIVNGLARIEGSSGEYDDDVKKAAVTLIRRTLTFTTAALHANAANVVAANAFPGGHRAIANGRVLGGYFTATVAVTAHAADNAELGFVKLHANGAAATPSLCTANTAPTANAGTGSLVVGVPVELTPATGANARFLKGQMLAPQLAQNASGVALPAGTYTVDVELEGPADDYGV